MIPLAITLAAAILLLPPLVLYLALRAFGHAARLVTELQEHVMTSSANAMSVAARSLTAPYSVGQAGSDGEGALLPAAPSGPVWQQDDELPVGDMSDPTDGELPDPAWVFRPDARMLGEHESGFGVQGLTVDRERYS